LSGRPHLVTVGGSDARKGTDRAIAALGLLVTKGFDLSLLVVGHLTAAWGAELETTARACGVAERVFFAGAVDDELLRACYRRAVVTVMPSLAEGAGLPVLESAASGTPALASSTTALAETAAHPAALFDPTDVGAMAEVIAAAVDSPERRTAILAAQQRLAAASTWDAVADRAVAAMGELVGSLGAGRSSGAGPSAPPWPFRLALVGWPPLEDDLLGAISRAWRGEVEVVVAGPGGSVLPTGHRAWPGGAFGTDMRPASYDGVVYVLTGAPSDDWVLEQAGRFPGWLWVWEAALPLRLAVDSVVRRSRGVLVAGGAVRDAVRLALRPLAALPPIVVVPTAPAGADDLVAAVRPDSKLVGPGPAWLR
jgi:hypothetical protein